MKDVSFFRLFLELINLVRHQLNKFHHERKLKKQENVIHEEKFVQFVQSVFQRNQSASAKYYKRSKTEIPEA